MSKGAYCATLEQWNHDFIEYFVCATCIGATKQNVRFKCNLGKCNNRRYIGKNAYSFLIQHLKKHHHTDEGVRDMLDMKYCGKSECNELIGMNKISCDYHKNVNMDRQLVSEFDPDNPMGAIQSNLIESDVYDGNNEQDDNQFFTQRDGQIFEMKDLLYYIAINRAVPKPSRKARVAVALTSALTDLNTKVNDKKKRIHILNRGIIKWK